MVVRQVRIMSPLRGCSSVVIFLRYNNFIASRLKKTQRAGNGRTIIASRLKKPKGLAMVQL